MAAMRFLTNNRKLNSAYRLEGGHQCDRLNNFFFIAVRLYPKTYIPEVCSSNLHVIGYPDIHDTPQSFQANAAKIHR
jgi:hypothetical protein